MVALLLFDTQLTEFNLAQNSVYFDQPGEYYLTGYTLENTVEIVCGCTVIAERLYCDVIVDSEEPVHIVLRASSELGLFDCGDSPVYVTSEDGFGSLNAREYIGSAYFAHCIFNGESYGHYYEAVITKRPTVLREGKRAYVCFACGDAYTEPVVRLSIDWSRAWRGMLYAALWGAGVVD